MLKKLTGIVTEHPVITIALILLLTCCFFYGLMKVEVSADVKNMLPADDKRVTTFEEVDKKFGGADFIMLVLETGDIFTYQVLKSVDNLTQEIGELSWVSSVRSITNSGEIKGVEYGLEIIELIDEIPDDAEELEKLKKRILSSKNAVGVTVSEDGRVAVIVIQMQPDSDGKEALQELDEVLAKSDFNGTIHQIGLPVMENYVGTVVREDMKLLIPFVILVVIIVLFMSFRNLRGVILPLSVAGISTIWTLGLMGFLRVPLSNVSNIIPIVLIGVGTAYAIHILSHYSDEHGNQKRHSGKTVMKTMEIVALAILLAAITTMIGFAANCFSPLNPIRETGVFTAFGVLAAFLISITLIPAILTLLKTSNKPEKNPLIDEKEGRLEIILKKLSQFTGKKPFIVLFLATLLFLPALISIPKLSTEFNMLNFYKPGSPPVKAYELMNDRFGGADVIQVLVKGDILDPDVLNSMEQFQNEIEAIDVVGSSYSLVNVLKDVNQALNEGGPEYRVVPRSRDEAAQFLLLLSIGGADDIDRLISFEYDQAVITARIGICDGDEKVEILTKIEALLESSFNGEKAGAIVTGMPVLEQAINELIVEGQLRSLLFAILFVLILMMIVTRSFIHGIICTLPVAITVAFNFGLMSLCKVPLDIATAMIACVAIGIGVDYSIHFFNRYKIERKAGKTKEEAICATTTTTGKAILFNALAVGLGFLVLIFSSFPPLGNFGWLIALTMLVSSCSALTVLPSLLLLTDKGSKIAAVKIKQTKQIIFKGEN